MVHFCYIHVAYTIVHGQGDQSNKGIPQRGETEISHHEFVREIYNEIRQSVRRIYTKVELQIETPIYIRIEILNYLLRIMQTMLKIQMVGLYINSCNSQSPIMGICNY